MSKFKNEDEQIELVRVIKLVTNDEDKTLEDIINEVEQIILEYRAHNDEESPKKDEYYLQDTRSYVGNDVLWWALGGGYTTDASKAQVFSEKTALSYHKSRSTDLPWVKSYIDGKTRPAVDFQYIDKIEGETVLTLGK